jgi:hypothetical protein
MDWELSASTGVNSHTSDLQPGPREILLSFGLTVLQRLEISPTDCVESASAKGFSCFLKMASDPRHCLLPICFLNVMVAKLLWPVREMGTWVLAGRVVPSSLAPLMS